MKCPHCASVLTVDAQACHACGFNAALSSERHGDHLVRLERLTDAAHCLRLTDVRVLEGQMDDFERRFPQIFAAVYFGVLPTGLTTSETGFWLLNHAAFGTHDISKRNEFGIILVIDPAAGSAGFTLGYAIEALTPKLNVAQTLSKMRRHLAASDYGRAVATAVDDLGSQLKKLGRTQKRNVESSRMHTLSNDLGFSPLRPKSRTGIHNDSSPGDSTVMKTTTALISGLLIGAAALLPSTSTNAREIDDVLPLPQWEQPRATGAPVPLLGSSLFPEGSAVEQMPENAPLLQPPHAGGSEFPAANPANDLSLFLPDSLLGKTIREYQPPPPTPEAELRPLGAGFLAACRAEPTSEHLIDPDRHVLEPQREDLARFLGFHARDARIKAFVLVMDRNQTVNSAADLAGVASCALHGQDSCLAVYPLGEPWRARLFVSSSVHQAVDADYLNSVAQDCAKDATLVSDPLEQLHRFSVRLSIRLFWLEKLMSPQVVSAGAVTSESLEQSHDTSRPAAMIRHRPSKQRSINAPSMVLGVLLGLAGGAAAYGALRYRRKRMLNYVWILPEIEMPQRLGGAFTGGGGACIQYR